MFKSLTARLCGICRGFKLVACHEIVQQLDITQMSFRNV